MNNKKITTAIIALFAMFVSTYSIAQKIEAQTATYVRNGLSIHFATPTTFTTDIVNSIKVSEKYDDNSFGDNTLKLNSSINIQGANSKDKKAKTSNSVESEVASQEYKAVLEAIASQKIPNKILSKILLNDNGKVDYTNIFKRGEYNATDNSVLAANASNEGIGGLQSDAIFNVLKNVYFLVQQNGTISTKSSKDATTYSIPFKSYLLQLDLSELFETNQFFKTFSQKDPEVVSKINNYSFKVKLISVASGEGVTLDKDLQFEGLKLVSKQKTQQQTYLDLANASVDASLTQHANNYEPFKVKTRINSVGPITAKIGKKEGLRIDDRFEVFRNKIDEKTGNKFARKLGYLRVAKVADNASVATGNTEPSKFYKAPARGVDKNDVMKELPETGIQVGAEIAFGEASFIEEYSVPYTVGRTTYYNTYERIKSKSVTMPMINVDYVTHLLKGNRLGVSLAFKDGSTVAIAEVKQVIQLNRLTFTPGVGYLYYLSLDDTGDSDPQLGGVSGSFKMGLELGKNFQINLGPRFIADAVSGNLNAYFGLGIRVFGF